MAEQGKVIGQILLRPNKTGSCGETWFPVSWRYIAH